MIIGTGNNLFEVKKAKFGDKWFLDIRRMYKDKATGELKPTKKGVAVPLDLVESLETAIVKALDKAVGMPEAEKFYAIAPKNIEQLDQVKVYHEESENALDEFGAKGDYLWIVRRVPRGFRFKSARRWNSVKESWVKPSEELSVLVKD